MSTSPTTMIAMPDRSSSASKTGGVLRAIATVYETLNRVPYSVIAGVARVAAAQVFFRSGMLKLDNWDLTIGLFRDEYQVPVLPPEVAAYLGTATELMCPVLLVLGLLSRPAAAMLLGMTSVIQLFIYPESWTDHILWAGLLLIVLLRGPGKISLDYPLGRALLGR